MKKNNICKCCEEIKFWKTHTPDKENFKEKIFAKISVYTWRKHQRANKGEQISTVTSAAFDLKYCPSCGTKVKEI